MKSYITKTGAPAMVLNGRNSNSYYNVKNCSEGYASDMFNVKFYHKE